MARLSSPDAVVAGDPSAAPAVHARGRDPEGAAGRGRLEHAAIPSGWRSRIRRTAAGATARSSSTGPREIVAFLKRKWARELDYRLIKELWAFGDNRIAVRFAYEWHDDAGNWFRSYGNENWEFDADGLMAARHASINDLPIARPTGKYRWPQAGGPPITPG